MTWANIVENKNNKNNKKDKKDKKDKKKINNNKLFLNIDNEILDYNNEIENLFEKKYSLRIFDDIFNELKEQKKCNFISLNIDCSDIISFFEEYIDKEGSIKIPEYLIYNSDSDSDISDY
jgi:hypothetical protein